jgi:hypothetical protein
MRLHHLVIALLAALVSLMPVRLLAQSATTGRITGTVMDEQRGVIPGATLTVSSPQLLGTRTSFTDGVGEFRFLALPPGTYSVKAELNGFEPVQFDNVLVNVNSTVILPITMKPAAVPVSVEVHAAVAPTVDTTSTQSGLTATSDVFESLPMRRDFYAVARLAPGVSPDAIGSSGARPEYAPTLGTGVYGATGVESQYIIDGVNVTGVSGGEQLKSLNTDFVQEVQVLTTGLNAEYGRMNGGLINVVTRSGGDAFHGSAFGFYEGGALTANNSTAPQRPQFTTTILDTKPIQDGGGSLGGYLLKNTLWFFGAYDRTASTDQRTIIRSLTAAGSPALGATVPSDVTTGLYAGKLTWRASNNHTVWVSTNGDPSTRTGYIFGINGPPSTWQGTLERGAPNFTGHYDGVFGTSLLVRGILGRDHEKATYGGAGSSIPAFQDATFNPRQDSGGFGPYMNQNFTRTVYKADAMKFWGAHEIKVGADYEDVVAGIRVYDGGAGQAVRKFNVGGLVFYRHRFLVNDRVPGFDPQNSATWVIANPLVASPSDRNTSFYLQDSYKVLSNLSVNYGVRWERERGLDRDGNTAYDINDSWAPRIGITWDPTREARSKVFASFARYYANIPLDMNIRDFSGFIECLCFNFSPDPAVTAPDPALQTAVPSILGGAGVEPTDPSLKGMYTDEWTAGVEFELPNVPKASVSAKLTRRSLGRAVEDFLSVQTGNYAIGNPGEGTYGSQLASFVKGESVPTPKAIRKDTSLELTLRKRYADNWQLLASYVWSNLVGNYDGQYEVATGQLDPGGNAAFDLADFMVNAYGHLSSERKHQVKVDGSYTLSGSPLKGLTVASSFHWYSGFPLTAYGFQLSPYASWDYFLTPRGALGRGPSDYEADAQIVYPVRLARNVRADLQFAVFNLFNRQSINQLYSRYNESTDGTCAGIPQGLCNGDNGIARVYGTITPVGQIPDPRATATSPDFLKTGVGFTGPRSARIGVRLTF